jgi:hypothetical protein
LQLIGRDPDGKTIIAALTMLAEHLDRHGAPIDYPRRDHLAASVELIDADSWDGICQAAGTPPVEPPSFEPPAYGSGRRSPAENPTKRPSTSGR